jgi:superfamily II DNA or RNA helicase
LIVDRWLKVDFSELTAREMEKLEKQLTYMKPNGDIVISYRKLPTKGCYLLPRGAWNLMPDHIRYSDKRTKPEMPELDFSLTLDAVEKDPRFAGQAATVRTMLEEQQGLILRPPGSGKTQIACAFAAACQTRVLVLVHTHDILKQWVDYIENAIPEMKGKVGIIRGKTCRIRQITVATVQTLNASYLHKGRDWWAQWGALIADEGHHVAAPSWESVINACPAFYRFGFTASATRADGMHPSMRFIIGPVIAKQKFTSSVPLKVIPVRTAFTYLYRGRHDWTRLVTALVEDRPRNRQIAKVADREIEEGNSVLVLSRRIEHLEKIAEEMREECEILAAARITKKERDRILTAFRSGEIRCVLATQLADEALDVPRLNRVLLTHPGKHEGRIIQQIGRALRKFTDKDDAKVYDFVDWKVRVLRRQWDHRKRTYIKEGISIKTRRVPRWKVRVEKKERVV